MFVCVVGSPLGITFALKPSPWEHLCHSIAGIFVDLVVALLFMSFGMFFDFVRCWGLEHLSQRLTV